MIYANKSALDGLKEYIDIEKNRYIKECIDSYEAKKKSEIDRLVNEFIINATDRYRNELEKALREDISRLDNQLRDFVYNIGLRLESTHSAYKQEYDVHIILNINK